ncbi:MAG: CusA/CzcA family heavy metal efflux RND transporter [Gemmatimonadales bacterium]|nr:CusA/CzcA family heavy metal efflux RND transporter [Gemmatimonadales bacterium]
MLERLVRGAIGARGVVAGATAVLLAAGLWALSTLPFEAFPDLTANSVNVITEAPGYAPQEVEQLVTFPIERSLLGLPRATAVRSTSKFGLVITQVVFEDGVDPYFARTLVTQRLADAQRQLPAGVQPQLGPLSTAMGEVFQYVLTARAPEWTTTRLKTLQDFTLAPQLRTVPGVAEVNSWGGRTEQVHVEADPRRLALTGLSLGDVERAFAENNRSFGGAYTESRGERFVVRGLGRVGRAEEIAAIPVAVRGGVPILVGDVATVREGALPREGAVTHNGRGEVVAGMVIMRKGENARDVIARVQARVAELRATLPPGVELVPFYDQAELVARTTHTISKNLLLGGTLVVMLLWAFLRSVAAGLIVAVVIPLSMLWAFVAMRLFGYSANLMSLGALDFGLLVDGSVVVVENVMRRAHDRAGSVAERMAAATLEVGRPVVFGIGIIIAVYVPLFALEGLEGRMFIPMAFTVVAAVLGSLLLALTVVPAAARTFLEHAEEPHSPAFDRFRARYERLLHDTLRHRRLVVGGAVALVGAAVWAGSHLGLEFMPRLDEGAVLVQSRRLPSTAIGDGVQYSLAIERKLAAMPEVSTVVSKLGRPDLATDAMGAYESDTYIMLRDRATWRPGGKAALVAAMDSALREVPGLAVAFTQPIQMRLDEAETGITTDVGVRIFGPDVEELARLARRVEAVLRDVPGAADVKANAANRVKQLAITLDRPAMARLGVTVDAIAGELERALGASIASQVVDGPRRIGIAVRIPDANRLDPPLLGLLPVPTPAGARVPLQAVARLAVVDAPETFAHEGGQRLVVVGANIRGRDVVGFVDDARARLARQVPLPVGYRYEWGGQYTHQQTAAARLRILVPLSILAILLLLWAAFRTVRHPLLIMTNVPFALVGGVMALWLAGLDLSVSALIGFIALFGIAVLNGVVLVTAVNDRRAHGEPLEVAVVHGAAQRLRPVLMTAAVAGLGFVPMATSQSAGAELQRPLAVVVIGGLVTATLLTLLVVPTLYAWVERRTSGRADGRAATGAH